MDSSGIRSFGNKKRVKSLRTRPTSPSEERKSEVNDGGMEVSASSLATKLKNKHKERTKSKSKLSFGLDEDKDDEGDVFKVKKSNLSRKLKLASSTSPLVSLTSDLEQASISPQYSKEYLSELKASTSSLRTTRQQTSETTGIYDSDLSFDASELAGAVIVGQDETIGVDEIPSESSILAAKEKRDRLRKTKAVSSGAEEDFISLSVSRKEDIYQGPHPESRLMREDDDLGEGDDEFAEYTSAQERVALGKKARKKEAATRRAAIQELIADADEEDEETIEWERAQVRRAGKIDEVMSQSRKMEYRPAPIPTITPLPVLGEAVSRLSKSLSDLTVSHATSTASMSNLADERIALEKKRHEMQALVEKAEKKRSWFSAFREWVETVATFLDEKYPLLEKLEEEHVSLLKERGDMISKRRSQDDEDDLSLFLGSLPVQNIDEEEKVDETGRIIPRLNPTVVRKERRAQRTARHGHRANTSRSGAQEEEGFSTDATLTPSDESDYRTALSQLAEKGSSVLQDVKDEEFRDPSVGVAKWFGTWRTQYSDTYVGAFGGLGMVSTWEFWVRLEMLGWDPVEDSRSLDSFAWFGSLYEYSRPRDEDGMDEDEDTEEPPLGPDGDLVSAMISTAVVPRLCKVIQGGAFDAYSAKHVKRLVDLAEQVESSSTQEKYEMLQKSIIIPFRNAVDQTIKAVRPYLDLPMNNAPFDPEAISARRRYLSRQRKLISNLLRWRRHTGEKFGVGQLITRIIIESMRPVAGTGWDVGGSEILQKVLDILPPEIKLQVDNSAR